MQCGWLGERVAAPSLRVVVRNALTKETAGNWGPNATFRFPTRGGTGGIWTAIGKTLPLKMFRLGKSGVVDEVDADAKVVHLGDGRKVRYRNLVSTIPLDKLLERTVTKGTGAERIGGASSGKAIEEMRAAATGLVYSNTIVLGVGLRGVRPERIGDKCECQDRSTKLTPKVGYTSQKITPRSTALRSSRITLHTMSRPPTHLSRRYDAPTLLSPTTERIARDHTGA